MSNTDRSSAVNPEYSPTLEAALDKQKVVLISSATPAQVIDRKATGKEVISRRNLTLGTKAKESGTVSPNRILRK